jgi:hypothetical protein
MVDACLGGCYRVAGWGLDANCKIYTIMGLLSTTHIHKTRTEYVPYAKEVNITEKRAPTDESVKLFSEFRQKALDNIVDSFHIDTNILKAEYISFRNDAPMDTTTIFIKINLNGEEFKMQEIFTRQDQYHLAMYFHLEDRRPLIDHLIEFYSKILAKHLVIQLGEKAIFKG